MIDFDEYIRQGERKSERKVRMANSHRPTSCRRSEAIRLPHQTARKDIEGEITFNEAKQLIRSYYQSKASRTPEDSETYEADTASTHIRQLLTEKLRLYIGRTDIHSSPDL